MHAAPAVSVRGSGGVGWRLVRSLVPALAAAASTAWLLGLAQGPVAPALGVAPVVFAFAWWRVQPVAQTLSWDGQRWLLEGQEGGVVLMMDLGAWLLLRFDPDAPAARRQWVAVSRSAAGAALHGLRAAVYCRPPEPTPGTRTAPDGPTAARPD